MATLTLRPNADGTYHEWVAEPWGSAHWIDTSDQDDNTFIYTGIVGNRDTENLADTPQTGTINSVTTYARTRQSGGNCGLYIICRTHNTDYFSGQIIVTSTLFTNKSQTRTVNPFTGAAWTWDEVNALEVGGRSGGIPFDAEIDIAEFWIVVDYTPVVIAAPRIVGDGLTCLVYMINPSKHSNKKLLQEVLQRR
jgi:hypothetical protein